MHVHRHFHLISLADLVFCPFSFPPGPCLLLWTPDGVDGTSSATACTTVASCGKESQFPKKSPRIGTEFQVRGRGTA